MYLYSNLNGGFSTYLFHAALHCCLNQHLTSLLLFLPTHPPPPKTTALPSLHYRLPATLFLAALASFFLSFPLTGAAVFSPATAAAAAAGPAPLTLGPQ
jgi:hypothetical protein